MRWRPAELAFPLLRRLDAERAHDLALAALRSRLAAGAAPRLDPRLATRVFGLDMPNPIGLAAGFDKNAEALGGLMRLGFGSIEAGTVTRLAQPGNPRPRLFRLPEEAAVINRMGFNNRGVEAFRRNLDAAPRMVPIGVNIGLNRTGADPALDYPALVAAVRDRADWISINVSSPNTPGLRDLQAPRHLQAILQAIRTSAPEHPPLLVKLAPDLPDADLPDIVDACIESGAAGLILTNTTLARPAGLRGRHAGEAGGLSGRPLLGRSTALLAAVARLARGRLLLVGAGGIVSGEDVLAKLRAGASFVQLYTAFALQGPALLPRLRRELLAALDRQGFPDVAHAIGSDL
jgi:dihydroorotate dehydrogenase